MPRSAKATNCAPTKESIMNRIFPAVAILLVAADPMPKAPLPVVETAWPAFRKEIRQMLRDLEILKAPLSPATTKAITIILDKSDVDPGKASGEVQKLLDAHCLISIHINPESRVKAARGSLKADLVRD